MARTDTVSVDAVSNERIRTLLVNSITTVCLALVASASFSVESTRPCYTIQILSAPAARRDQVRSICETLQRKGHMAYCTEARVRGKQYLRLRVGAFHSRAAAQAYATDFAPQEGCDYLVVQANVFVDSFGDAFDVVTTPDSVWLKSTATTRRLYHYQTDTDAKNYSPAQISPAGKAIAFYHDNQIVRIDLPDGSANVLREGQTEDELFQTLVCFSPDGRYLAYLDRVGWELPTKLWVMRADGSDNRCLVGDETGATKVKSFLWHPQANRLFYVAGPAHGTVSVGGDLGSVDLTGRRQTLVKARLTDGIEVAGDFSIANDRLYYRLAHFDADRQTCRYSEHHLAIATEAP